MRDIHEKATNEIDHWKKAVRVAEQELKNLKAEKRTRNIIAQRLGINVNNPKKEE